MGRDLDLGRLFRIIVLTDAYRGKLWEEVALLVPLSEPPPSAFQLSTAPAGRDILEATVQDVDFAISYAGEDEQKARELDQRLRELGFSTFFAGEQRHLLAGVDGEAFFEKLFAEATVVVPFISVAYRRKIWTRFEWDVILGRPESARCLPVRLDESVRLLGLPSSVIYLALDSGWDLVVKACVSLLLRIEDERGIHRPTEYENILRAIRDDSRGALAEAFQLAKEQRRRTPLADTEVRLDPNFNPSYSVVRHEWYNFSVVRRLGVRVLAPPDLTADELRWNLWHCCAVQFNAYKPDAVVVFAYLQIEGSPEDYGAFTAGKAEFAPFGKWEKAQDGVAYNIPESEFEYRIELAPSYFD